MCSTNVVIQFARVAHATEFLYCYTILESNKRSEYAPNTTERREQPGAPTLASGIHPTVLKGIVNPELNAFFPFDPYRLPKSMSYIQDIYREWSSVAIDEDEDEDEESDQENDNQDEERATADSSSARYLTIRRSDSREDEAGLGESLGKMSISPVHVSMSIGVVG